MTVSTLYIFVMTRLPILLSTLLSTLLDFYSHLSPSLPSILSFFVTNSSSCSLLAFLYFLLASFIILLSNLKNGICLMLPPLYRIFQPSVRSFSFSLFAISTCPLFNGAEDQSPVNQTAHMSASTQATSLIRKHSTSRSLHSWRRYSSSALKTEKATSVSGTTTFPTHFVDVYFSSWRFVRKSPWSMTLLDVASN